MATTGLATLHVSRVVLLAGPQGGREEFLVLTLALDADDISHDDP